MDFNLKQWRDDQSEEEEQETAAPPSAKLPRLLFNSHPQQPPASSSALPLFVPEPTTNLSAYSSDHSTATSATKFHRMGNGYFSLSQWQELELQAMIFRHMIAGAAVPPELLHLVKKSLINSPTSQYYLSQPFNQYYPHYQPALLQSGYWGRAAMDPEPGRCRRTDGKKWRCSRDVVAGQKYCERHMHRGRTRSRKPVETTISTTSLYGGSAGGEDLRTNHSITTQGVAGGGGSGGNPHFTLSGPSRSTELRPSDTNIDTKGLSEPQNDGQPSGRLRRFFDDWPRPVHETENAANSVASATNLSIAMPGNSSSDFSLKLGTGHGDHESSNQVASDERNKLQLNWGATWETKPVAPVGGPLAEAFRSSTSNSSSPTSVLYRLQRGPASEASYVST